MALPGAGDLRERVTIEQVATTRDAIGGEIQTWSALATVWAMVAPVSVGEQFRRQQIQASANWKITIRYRADVNPLMRIVWRGHTYHIRGLLNPDVRRRFLEIACEEMQAVPTSPSWTADGALFDIQPTLDRAWYGNAVVSIPSVLSCVRPSPKYQRTVAGLLVLFGNNVLPYTDFGLLVEGQQTNLFLRSDTPNVSPWANSGSPAFASGQNDPYGGTVAFKVTHASGGFIRQPITLAPATTYTISRFFKYFDTRWLFLNPAASSDFGEFWFDVQNGVIGHGDCSGFTFVSQTIIALANGWYRVSATFTTASNTGLLAHEYLTGADQSVIGANGSYICAGAQLEAGALASSYIATTNAPATRAADAISLTIPAGVGHIDYTFDDASVQTVAVSPGAYTIPTNLNRATIARIVGRP